MQLRRHRRRTGGTLLLHRAGDLLHLRRLGAGADGVGEDVHLGKVAAAQEGQRLGKFLLRLAGKAADQIRGDGGPEEVLPQQSHGPEEPGGVIPAIRCV